MKRIFITSFHPMISRNILGTPIIPLLLKDPEIEVFIICSEHKMSFFKAEFEDKRVHVVGVQKKKSWRNRFLNYLALSALQTESLRLKRQTEMKGSGILFSRFFANPAGRHIVRLLSSVLTPRHVFDELFKTNTPSIVFSTDLQHLYDVGFLEGAKRHGVKTLGMMRSWDNLTSKGALRFIPDIFLVHNEVEKKEAMDLNNIQASKFKIVGIPHYDFYANAKPDRNAFLKKFGIDPGKKIVLFAPIGDRYVSPNTVDRDILKLLDELLPLECVILVRFPFTDSVLYLDGKKSTGRIIYDRPTVHFSMLKNNELGKEDEEHLVATLAASALVVTGPSTIAVDAAFFDKPVILIGFDGNEVRPYLQGVRRYFEYNHWKPVLETKGVRMTESKDALKNALAEYLNNPSLDRENREKIVEVMCAFRDGGSSQRIADIIHQTI